MKRNTPLITLLAGAALGVILLISSMLVDPLQQAGELLGRGGFSGVSAGYGGCALVAGPGRHRVVTSLGHIVGHPGGIVRGPGGIVRGSRAIARGIIASGRRARAGAHEDDADQGQLRGPGRRRRRVGRGVGPRQQGDRVRLQRLDRRGLDAGHRAAREAGPDRQEQAHLTATYHAGKVTGDVEAHGTDYSFSAPTANKSSGLYQATAKVQGKTIKAGWIVLNDGTQIGSLETDADSAAPSAVTAPKLDLATMTARLGDLVLHAVPVSGVTGSGF